MSSQTDAPLEEASRQVSNGEEDFLDFLIAEPPVRTRIIVILAVYHVILSLNLYNCNLFDR